MKQIHFWQFKDNSCIKIEKEYMSEILQKIFLKEKIFYKTARKMKITELLLREVRKTPSKKMQLQTLKKIIKFARKIGIKTSLKNCESKVCWIGYSLGRGITNPKLPFDLNVPSFATVMSASFGDGTITNINRSSKTKYKLGSFEYWNENRQIRENVIQSAINVFGGYHKEYKVVPNRNSYVVFFPAIIRDLLLMTGGVQGEKSIHNPSIPSVIRQRKQKIFWLKQAFDDEGSVRFRTRSNHEVYLTRVNGIEPQLSKKIRPDTKMAFNQVSRKLKKIVRQNPPTLLCDEEKFLSTFNVECRIKPLEIYITKSGKTKVKWRLYITRKQNIKNFAKVIGFTDPNKSNILKKIVGDKIEFTAKNQGKSMANISGKTNIEKMDTKKILQIQFEKQEKNIQH